MDHVAIHGAKVPLIGLGTYRLVGAACRHAVRLALDLGYRHIDTGAFYGNEAEVGAALAESGVDRAAVFLSTKIWMDALDRRGIERTTDASLRQLRTDYVDLLLLHWPSPDVPMAESLDALAAMRAAGKARHIGVSNYPVALLREALETHGAHLFCDQVEYHPLLSQRRLLDYARPRGLLLIAYCPLARGAVQSDPVLRRIAEAHNRSPAQIALRWLIEQDNVAAIPKASGETRLRANLAVFDFALSDADRAAIAAINGDGRTINPPWAPAWDPP